ncbi:MAG: hypothetical protein RLZZ385_640 [Pseudomonadota bacterium]|jgi:tRNA pseudouridine13 synthase
MPGSDPAIQPFADLPFAWGRPAAQGLLKRDCSDFQVDEISGFTPTGQGDHLCLQLRKTGLTTTELATHIARRFAVDPADVGYAGMKDKRAVTTQWFSVKKPARRELHPEHLEDGAVQVLAATDNSRKIHIGSHRGNRFRIRLHEVVGDRQSLEQRLATVAERGVPNYYGAQRFGSDMGNVHEALRLFGAMSAGGARPSQRSSVQTRMAVSAARAYLFNQILALRISGHTWASRLAGEVFALDGTARCFVPDPDSGTDELDRRLAILDIHPTGLLDGRVDPRARYAAADQVLVLEAGVMQRHGVLHEGLLAMGLDASRRALRLAVRELHFFWPQADTIELSFELAAGGYATSVLRELCATAVPAGNPVDGAVQGDDDESTEQ